MTATQRYENPTIDRIFGVVLEKQTYKNIGYLLLSFPLGLLYFLLVVPGISLSVSLMIVVAGFPLLLGIILVSDQILRFERHLMSSVLGSPIVVYRPDFREDRRLFARLGERLAQARTWKGLFYLVLRFAMGLASFVLVVVLVPCSLVLLTLPLTFEWASFQIGNLPIQSFDQALIGCSLGAVLALISSHIINGWTSLWKRIAIPLLS